MAKYRATRVNEVNWAQIARGKEGNRADTPARRQLAVIDKPRARSLDTLPPRAVESGVSGACHELVPGLKERDQPRTVATGARLGLPCA